MFRVVRLSPIDDLILLLYVIFMDDASPESKAVTQWQKTQYANLIRYVSSGVYFARLRVKGKLIRKSLKTDNLVHLVRAVWRLKSWSYL